ncbi:MAG: alpha/beta fold hydrolase [Deltaproteobacteria bacterium]|nr:alpha/beta fold hydrolase [Deltaproteobacteria bacterium]
MTTANVLKSWTKRLTVLAAATWFGLSGVVTWTLTHRERPAQPERLPPGWSQGVEPLRLRADDGVELGAWWHAGATGQPAVVLLHGNGGSRSRLIGTQILLQDQGLSVLSLTLRGHGDSGGEQNDIGFSAQRDVAAAVRWLREHRPGQPIVLFGQSLGAAAAVFAAGRPDVAVSGLWLECPYRDLATAVDDRLRLHLPALLRPVAWAGLRLWSLALLPDLDEIAPAAAMAKVPAQLPVWVLAGGQDELAPVDGARAVLGNHTGKLVVFPTGAHLGLRIADEETWLREWQAFLAAVRPVS